MLVMTACNDDIDMPATVDGPEGEDTTISLTIQAPEMSHLESRADMTTDEANITNSTSVMMTTVADDEYAIGYISLGSLDGYLQLRHKSQHTERRKQQRTLAAKRTARIHIRK